MSYETYEVKVFDNGGIEWVLDGKRHRIGGPAVTTADGSEYWYKEGKIHRLDGPAVTIADGPEYWYKEGKIHRLDGPAFISQCGAKSWFIEGKLLSEVEFIARTIETKELTVEQISELLGYEVKIVKG